MGRCSNNTTIDQVNSNNVIYPGPYLPTLQIQPNSNLTLILQTLDTFLSTFSGGTNYIIKGGISNQTADGLTLIFNIPHTLGQIPDTWSVIAANTQTANNFSVTPTLTNLVINYSVAPSQGTSLSWGWSASKL